MYNKLIHIIRILFSSVEIIKSRLCKRFGNDRMKHMTGSWDVYKIYTVYTVMLEKRCHVFS
jgi:hypothetical protein